MIPWAKMASDFDSNPKVAAAGFLGAAVYLFALRRNALMGGGGRLPLACLEPSYIADQLRCSIDDAATGMQRCIVASLLSVAGNEVAIVGWDDWDSSHRGPALSSTERSRKRRERLKYEQCNGRNVACNENATATAEERRVEESRSELSTDLRARDPSTPAAAAEPAENTVAATEKSSIASRQDSTSAQTFVQHAQNRLRAARKAIDPQSRALPAFAGPSESELVRRLAAYSPSDRMAELDHVIDMATALARERRDVSRLYLGGITTEAAWEFLSARSATAAVASRPTQRRNTAADDLASLDPSWFELTTAGDPT